MECLQECIRHDPAETPLSMRAKVSMEIYTLAEVVRLSGDDFFVFGNEPTAWDCQILPGLSFRPDFIWCFGHSMELFSTAGACEIESQQLGYVLILEVIEESAETHSTARRLGCNHGLGDTEREEQIRGVFSCPVGFVYVVVANDSYHTSADSSRVFFHKNQDTGEYEVLPSKIDSFQRLVLDVLRNLQDCFDGRKNDTVWV